MLNKTKIIAHILFNNNCNLGVKVFFVKVTISAIEVNQIIEALENPNIKSQSPFNGSDERMPPNNMVPSMIA